MILKVVSSTKERARILDMNMCAADIDTHSKTKTHILKYYLFDSFFQVRVINIISYDFQRSFNYWYTHTY